MRFDSYHPGLNFLYFTMVLTATILFQHPVFLAISFLCAYAYSIKLNRIQGALFGIFVLALGVAFGFWYAGYHHFGITVLRTNFIGNNMTLESLICGLSYGITISAVMLWFSCIHKLITRDKIVYLFGKISPRASLFLAIILRLVPRIKEQAGKIQRAQACMGRGIHQGNIWERLCNCLRICSILITWVIESFVISSDSMRSRGNHLKGRTAFSIYRFDNRDRGVVIALFCCLTLIIMAYLLKETQVWFDPRIILRPITSVSYIFYLGYAFLCLLPLGLQIAGEIHFKKLQRKIS